MTTTAVNSAGRLVLAEAQFGRIAVLERDEAVNHDDAGHVLGEAPNRRWRE